jgi:hypothetical protein
VGVSLRAVIRVFWWAGLRLTEAPAPAETDLDGAARHEVRTGLRSRSLLTGGCRRRARCGR